MNTSMRSSPGCRLRRTRSAAIGYQPCATESRMRPSAIACGLSQPLNWPRNSSQLVSNPTVGSFTEKNA